MAVRGLKSLTLRLVLTFLGAATALCEPKLQPETAAWPAADLFAKPGVCRISLEINPVEFEKLRRDTREFVRASLLADGIVFSNVAVHLKGSVGSFRPIDDKPGFTLDFDRFNAAQRFHGLRRIHLNNSVEDQSYCNDYLGSEIFRAAGIPAPRVSWAVVSLNSRRLGLFVLKEGFTEDFLSCYFKKIGGDLYEPGEGHDVNQRLKRASIQAPSEGRSALKALGKAALEADPNQRWRRLQATLALDEFFEFMVLEVMLCHRDGYSLARNNFRVYHDLDSGKMLFFPHGMDQLFGRSDFPWRPHMAGLVAKAALETTEGKQRYGDTFRTVFKQRFDVKSLTNQVDNILRRLASSVDASEFADIRQQAALLKTRIIERHLQLDAQLNGSEPDFLTFNQGIGRVTGWTKTDEPADGKMDELVEAGGIKCLHIVVRSEASPSWRAKATLRRGRYRMKGRARVAGVVPLGYGTHTGAALRIGGESATSENLLGESGWRELQTEFEVTEARAEVEFICQLRARAGEAWFDCESLQVAQIP